MSTLEMQPVVATLNKMEMLFWRLDLSKRSFINLNEHVCGVLGFENYRFFKDRKYRERTLFPDDLIVIDRAFSNFKDRVMVRTVFRVQSGGIIHWFKLTGWPTSDYRYYEGTVEDISEHISRLKNIFEQQDQQLLKVGSDEYPIAIFNDQDKKLFNANMSFQKLFGIDLSNNVNCQLKELVKSETKLSLLMERLYVGRHLEVDLQLALAGSVSSKKNCFFVSFAHSGERYIRFAVIEKLNRVESDRSEAESSARRQDVDLLCSKIADCFSIDEMLNQIHESRDLFPGMGVVMFSDIYARKNKVFVYSKGEMKESLAFGSQFPYSGTIAENIEKENLEYLIVDDTQCSIKAIDWMLFVPKGICSYVAKALYVRGAIRMVLTFCSMKKNTFSENQIDDVTFIAKAFHQRLKHIRK